MNINNKTIKEFKSDYSEARNQEKALIFSFSDEFIKKIIDFVNKHFGFSVFFIQNIDSFIKQLDLIQYSVILLDADSVFYKLNGILNHIQDKRSRNKMTLIYLVTSNKEISSKLEQFKRNKRIITLFVGNEIVYLPGGKKYLC
jgi:hypothetical protein